MTLDDKLRAIRDIVQVDVGGRGLARDPNCNLINACPEDFAAACRSIGEHPAPSVGIVTGFWIADADPPCGETDGPLGAVYLARALHTLGIRAEIITDAFCRGAVEHGLSAAGIGGGEIVDAAADSAGVRPSQPPIAVLTLPPVTHPWEAYLVIDWLESNHNRGLTHLVSLERVGPAEDGRCYSMRGLDITSSMCPAERLVEHLARHRLTTIGIGDGGNEIGMGKIPVETIERNIPNGRKIACRVATDHLIVAGISNWGAYALAAGVALVRGGPLDEVLFDADTEWRILRTMVERGPLVDGKTARRKATVDGIDFPAYIEVLPRIRDVVRS